MKKLLTAAAAFAMCATTALADPVFGTWKTIPDDYGNFGHIKVAQCGSKICGTLVKSFDSAGKQVSSEHVGKKIIWDMKTAGNGSYAEGKVWAPDRDKTYNSKMTLSGNSLKIKGCIFGICRDGGTWTRVQ